MALALQSGVMTNDSRPRFGSETLGACEKKATRRETAHSAPPSKRPSEYRSSAEKTTKKGISDVDCQKYILSLIVQTFTLRQAYQS